MQEDTIPNRSPTHRVTENLYLSGNFAPVARETTAIELKVRGRIPEDLEGRLLRIGPNPAGPVDPARYHWFTGTGMVHGLRLCGGRAEWYRSRYTVNTDAAASIGKPPIPGPGAGYGPVNTHVTTLGGRTYALVEAGSLPIELDTTLESVTRSDFDGTLQGGFTAHPKLDPRTGENIALTYQPGRGSLRYVVVDASGRAQTRTEIPAAHGPMVHDVGFTDRFVVVLDLPVTFQPQRAAGSMFPYLWDERRQPRVGLLPRTGDLAALTWFDAPSCYVFHILNAYEDGAGKVVVDVVRHPRIFAANRLGPEEGKPILARWTLDLTRQTLTESLLDDRGCEFPRFDTRRGGQDYRFGYTAHWSADGSFGPAQKHDVRAARTEVHDFGPDRVSLEPVFVPRAGGSDEDDGYVMAYVFDGQRNVSDVVILAGQDFSGEPLAVVELPVRVPFGFHGDWIPDA